MSERDPELEGLFSDQADREVVSLLLARRPATPPLDPHFRSYLRSRLLTEARQTLPPPTRRQWLRFGPLPAMAAVAAGFLVVLVYQLSHQPVAPTASNRINVTLTDKTNVATAEPIKLTFSGPVDQNAVVASLVIQPATQYTTRWEGQTLVVIPVHQLAANTSYRLELQPAPAVSAAPSASVSAAPTVAPAPIIVRFVTAPTPPAPVTPPSYASANVTFLGDNHLADPVAFGWAGWTADGQILATRPHSEDRPSPSPSSSPEPSASASAPSAPAALSPPPRVMDLWLMSPKGVFIRKLADSVFLEPAISPTDGAVAFWHPAGDRYALMITTASATAEEATQLATVSTPPTGPPVWVGTDRIGYVDGGTLRLSDQQGNPVASVVPIPVSGTVSASADGTRLAAQTPAGAVLVDMKSGHSTTLPGRAASFTWSTRGDLAFVTMTARHSELWVVASAASQAQSIATSQPGEMWSNVNWSPDAASLLFTSRSIPSDSGAPSRAFLIDVQGGNPKPFGTGDYETLDWSPDGSHVLFTRPDETGQPALWDSLLKVGALSDLERAQQDAEAAVKTFMDARLSKDKVGAEGELGAAGQTAYQGGGLSLLSPTEPRFERWYPVTVQLVDPDTFLVGVRIVEASKSVETGYFQEILTVGRHDQRFLIDGAHGTPLVSLARGGPSVVSVEVRSDVQGQRVLIHFDSDLAVGTVNASSFLLRDQSGSALPVADVSYDQQTHLATLKIKLPAGTYTLVVTTAIEDVNAAPLPQEYSSPIVITPA